MFSRKFHAMLKQLLRTAKIVVSNVVLLEITIAKIAVSTLYC